MVRSRSTDGDDHGFFGSGSGHVVLWRWVPAEYGSGPERRILAGPRLARAAAVAFLLVEALECPPRPSEAGGGERAGESAVATSASCAEAILSQEDLRGTTSAR